ncbi:SCO family protein [Sabulilitoribacter arenilitoris]|uniref:SCO family protein n=1 Tax=Wocania arenilitoris TaxID=2044858 RepID=A0AAE3JKD8_9FLAO|nr:SCO family protein [Wocania arenilitoris]MCF7566932.1 SCO family protein [Wocania arenilitoris]
MLSFFKDYKGFAIVFAIISIIIIAIIYNTLNVYKPLTIYQPANFEPKLVDSTKQHVKKYHKIADFSLLNQNGDTISQKNYTNKIYVADFFFTTCQSICPIMTDNMVRIQNEILNDNDIMLLSHTVTPEIDSVEQLKRYAKLKGVIDSKWNLATGDREQIYNLARKSYLVVEDDPQNKYGMIHTENFALIDKEKRIRGIYNGISSTAIDSLLKDIEHLKKEYNK